MTTRKDAHGPVKIKTEQEDAPLVIPDTPTDGPLAPPIPDQPTDPPPVADEPEAESIKAKRGKVWVTYLGSADRFEFQDTSLVPETFTFEPGVPVEVPKDIAEALLTTPFEEFGVTDEVPATPTVEE